MADRFINNGTPWPPEDGPKFRVDWGVYIHAPDEVTAAMRALEVMRTTKQALCFNVTNETDDGETSMVDLK